jgi:hypothetical protein
MSHPFPVAPVLPAAPVLPFLALLLLVPVIGGSGMGPASLEAQEIRGGVSGAFSGQSVFSSSVGAGAGIRILPWNQLGFGLELDRWTFRPTVNAPVCVGDGGDCELEQVAMENRLETVTFLLLGELIRTEEWRFRVGFGRVAGRARGEGVSQDSDVVLTPPPADREGGALAWSRGADGTVVVLEILRALPIPGPLSPSLLASYRYHNLDLEGCVSGAFSPFCGPMALNELQVGIHLPIWPR